MNLPTIDVKPGSEVLIKRAMKGRFRFYGYQYTPAIVSRVTKARIFVRRDPTAEEREFNRSDLTERDANYNRSELVVEADKIAAARLEEAATKARRNLEAEGVGALARVVERYHSDRIQNRSDEEIRGLVEAVAKLLPPA